MKAEKYFDNRRIFRYNICEFNGDLENYHEDFSKLEWLFDNRYGRRV